MILNKLEVEGSPAPTVVINGWTYARVSDSIVNAWQDVVEHHFNDLCESTDSKLAQSIFAVDEVMTGGKARQEVEERYESVEAEREAAEEAYREAKGYS